MEKKEPIDLIKTAFLKLKKAIENATSEYDCEDSKEDIWSNLYCCLIFENRDEDYRIIDFWKNGLLGDESFTDISENIDDVIHKIEDLSIGRKLVTVVFSDVLNPSSSSIDYGRVLVIESTIEESLSIP
jgi:hypothetical protein